MLPNRSIDIGVFICSECSIGMCSAYLPFYLSIVRLFNVTYHSECEHMCSRNHFFFLFLPKERSQCGVEVVSICEIETDILDVPSCRCLNKEARCEKKENEKNPNKSLVIARVLCSV